MIMSGYYKSLLPVAATRYLSKLRVLGLEETDDPYWSKNYNKFIRFCPPPPSRRGISCYPNNAQLTFFYNYNYNYIMYKQLNDNY